MHEGGDSEYLGLYVTLASFTLILCLYVVVSFIRNPDHRKPPAGLMLSKTASDLIFSLIFFLMLLMVDSDDNTIDNTATQQCIVYGPLFILVFITGQGYFTSICWDLYRTLSNPFRKPAADSIKLHIFVWLFASILVGVCCPFNIFRYRESYGICYTCNTGSRFSYYNLVLIYLPMGTANAAGVFITMYAFKRLSNGLEKTFELRQQIIKRQLILVGCLTGLSVITVISWGILIYAPTFKQSVDDDCQKDTYLCLDAQSSCDRASHFPAKPRILLSILVFFNGGFDALAWFLLHKLTQKKTDKISKTINVTGHNLAKTELIGGDSNSQSEMNMGEDEMDHTEEKSKKPQNVSNALRGEIIAYMTAGLERAVHNTAKETYERVYSYGDMMDIGLGGVMDDDYDSDHDNGRDEEEEKLNKINQASHSRNKGDMLNCEEPEPSSISYPMNIHNDPKTHKGVINEIYVQLPTQHFLSGGGGVNDRLYQKFKSKIPVSHHNNMVNANNMKNNKSNKSNKSSLYKHVMNHNRSTTQTSQSQQSVHKKQTTDTDIINNNDMEEEEEEELLSSLDVKHKTVITNDDDDDDDDGDGDSIDDNNINEEDEDLSIYESGRSDVELTSNPINKKQPIESEENIDIDDVEQIKHQQLSEEDPPFHKQASTGSTAGAILGSITRTISRVATTLNTDNQTTAYNTDTFNDPMFNDEQNYSFYEGADNGNNAGDISHGVPFKDYAPHVFRYLRQQIYEISDEEYLQSVRPPDLEEQTKLVQEKFSEGRSGAFFFFTPDSKFIIKTVTKQEASLLLRILQLLVSHFTDNPHSLINRFFGLHSITMYNLNLYFVVLENVFVAGSKPHEIYDIKGSWIDRHTNHHVESGKLMKDQDLHKTLKLMPIIADNMYKQLKADSKFLAAQNIMDYSVLLGIYYVGIDPSDVQNDRIMQHHHDNAGKQSINNYVAPIIENEINIEPKELKLENSINGYPADLQTIRRMPDDYKSSHEHRPRAPSYSSGIEKYAQKDKAVRARVIEGPGIYYLGIIDVLQEWNTMKKLERMAKVYLRCKSKDGISCVEPIFYRKRFLRKMYRIGMRPIAKEANQY